VNDNAKAIRSALLTARRGSDSTAENIADYVADLLRQGRANEVTNDLIQQADPQRLHHHYVSGNTGQPMPMDHASRMARAAQMGFTDKSYHGTKADIHSVGPLPAKGTTSSIFGPQDVERHAFFSSPDKRFASDFSGFNSSRPGNPNVHPVMTRGQPLDLSEGFTKNADADRLVAAGADRGFVLNYLGDPETTWEHFDDQNGKDFTDIAKTAGYGKVNFLEPDAEGQNVHSIASLNPTDIRSQFARFDPRLSHLSHLSASTGGTMDLARAALARKRAGPEHMPQSAYMPGVPRQVAGSYADGGSALPKGYSIHVDPTRLGVLAHYRGKPVGQLTLSRDRDTGDLTAFQMAVSPKHQRKGLMSAMHDAAEQAFGPVKPDKTLTDQGFAFWKGYRPEAVSDNLRFHADKLIGQTVKTPYGPGTVKSVGRTGMNADLTDPDRAGSTAWAHIRDNEDVLRNVGVDPSTLKYAGGGAVEDSDNFRNWFGNSVTHTNGTPHVFYHGTSKDKDFTGFNMGRHGVWLTRDPEVASQYADQNDSQKHVYEGGRYHKVNTAGRVIPLYVKAENPYRGEYSGAVTGNYKKDQSDWFDLLRRNGHDAWIPDSSNGDLAVALKDPTQIKSIWNNGNFSPAQKHVGKADGGQVDEQAAAGDREAGPQAGGLPGSGGVRGGAGLLQAPVQASGQEDLIGLPKNVKLPKLGTSIVASHDPRIRAVAEDYMRTAGIPYNPPKTYQKVDPARAKRIADAYEAMPHAPNDPLVKASYDALLRETKGQYEAMKRAGVNLEFYPDPNNDPYKSNPRLAVEDLRHNNHMYVYPTDVGYGSGEALSGADENPMLRDSGERWNGKPVLFNDLFRAVHDYFGHAKEGVGFRADGEENAWRSHAAMFSPLARIALGTETRGQNSWLNYGPHGEKNRTAPTEDTVFADQKLGVLPHWVHHEGAEDFISPQERQEMARIYARHGKAGGGAETGEKYPVWTRSEFTPEGFSKALKSSPSASTLTQYDPSEVRTLSKAGKFEGYKLAGHDAYFGIKNGADYADDYGFEHPALTGKEKALVGVVNNDKSARGVGDSLMKEAIKRGVSVLDAFAVPSDKFPQGFLPHFYGKHGFKELGRIPFDPKYVTPEQFSDMKKSWAQAGWDEKRHPLPDVVIMKRAAGGFVPGQHRLTERFHNGGAAALMKRQIRPVSKALDLSRRATGARMTLKLQGD